MPSRAASCGAFAFCAFCVSQVEWRVVYALGRGVNAGGAVRALVRLLGTGLAPVRVMCYKQMAVLRL